MISFGAFELDPTQGLTRDGVEVRLTPKSLAVLGLLAERAGRVVSKDELFESVWADTAVTDSALATCIQEIRHALDDDAREPRYVETIHRRGYRFVASTTVADSGESPAPLSPIREAGPLVGRDAEVAAVLAAFESARRGTRQICFISGEPGIGKSAVFEASLTTISGADRPRDARSPAVAVTWAHCVERYGIGEPYQPLLDALMRLCRQPAGGRILEVLERYAPMWLAQLPGLLPARQFGALQQVVAGASRDRMLRELTYALEAIASQRPLVLGIEDLQWSDPSTLDWIATVAPRTEPARLLIVATTRPADGGGPGGPGDGASVGGLLDTLRAKHLATEVRLSGLDAEAAVRFVAARLPAADDGGEQHDRLDRLSRRIWAQATGNPLFISAALDQLVERGVIHPEGSNWRYSGDVDSLHLGVPETIRPIIDRQIERLSAAERELLETASVIDDRFPLGLLAAAVNVDQADAESVLASAECRRFVRPPLGEWGLGDGAPTYSFVHALYRSALYDGIPAARRAELHRRLGDRLEALPGDAAADKAAKLAVHFERGRDFPRAVAYLQLAGDVARQRSAFREARLHYERALALLPGLTPGAARDERELDLLMGLGAATMATSGFGAPAAEATYAAARTLSQRIGDAPRLFPALWGQWLFYWGRGTLPPADELAVELRARAIGADDAVRLQALHASWATSFSFGRFARATAEAEEGSALYDPVRHAAMAATYGSHDAGVCGLIFAARAMAFLGRVDEALQAGDEGIALARSLDHPFSVALSLTFRAAVAQLCGDPASAATFATDGRSLADDQGFALPRAWCTAIGGWAAARVGESGGVEDIERGIVAARSSGSDQFVPFLLGLFAEACLVTGRTDAGIVAADEALALAKRTGEQFYASELHRVRGELLLDAGRDRDETRQAFRSALEIARDQDAALLALRAAIRLARLSADDDADGADREVLRAARVALPVGLSVPDLAEADALL